MSKEVKIKIDKSMVKPAAAFESEMWAVAELDMTRLGTGERKILTLWRRNFLLNFSTPCI